MVIGIFGESCTGKSSIADELARRTGAKVFAGKDYLRMAKNEAEAKQKFAEMLKANEGADEIILFVIAEKELLPLLPEKAVRVLAAADIEIIKERFGKRMNGNLPAPVAQMLERKHGMFDGEKQDLRVETAVHGIDDACDKIISLLGKS